MFGFLDDVLEIGSEIAVGAVTGAIGAQVGKDIGQSIGGGYLGAEAVDSIFDMFSDDLDD